MSFSVLKSQILRTKKQYVLRDVRTGDAAFRSRYIKYAPATDRDNSDTLFWAIFILANPAEAHYLAFRKGDDNDLRPIPGTFSAIINVYAKSGDAEKASKAERLLAEMEQQSKKKIHRKPNTVSCDTVINVLAKSGERGAAVRAERLCFSIQKQDARRSKNVKCSTVTYNSDINVSV